MSAKDLLQGYEAIAEYLGITPRQAKHRARQKAIPTFKMGRTPCATKTGLREWMAAQMSEAKQGGR